MWLVLIFKGSFALVGLGAYFEILIDIPRRPLALALAAALIVINIVGVKETGRLQEIVVSVVLGALRITAGSSPGSPWRADFVSDLAGHNIPTWIPSSRWYAAWQPELCL